MGWLFLVYMSISTQNRLIQLTDLTVRIDGTCSDIASQVLTGSGERIKTKSKTLVSIYANQGFVVS